MGLFGRKKEQKACCGSNAAETMAGAQTGRRPAASRC